MSDYANEQVFRPPFIQSHPGGSEPLTVIFSLLSRADNSSLGERRLAPGHTLDVSGQPLFNPDDNSSENGFESNPNIHFEHWGEYWRKVHGVRFTLVEERTDVSLERLLRYNQLHRFAPGPTSSDAPPYRAPVDSNGKLWPSVIGRIEPYRRPRWDGVAYLSFANVDDVGIVLGTDRVREKIIPEDRAMFRDLAPMLARQHVIVPSATGKEAVTLVQLHVRRSERSREAFQRWWLEEHASFVHERTREDGYVKRYVQLHNVGPVEEGVPFFHPDTAKIDGVSLMSFANITDIEDFLRSPAYGDIGAQAAENIDVSASEYWTTIDITVVNRIHPELASK